MIEPVRKSVHVDAPPEHAFRVFTEHLADWWPIATHSGYEEDAATVTFEGVRFTPNAGGTRVELEHRAWEALGARAQSTRDRYDSGWPGVLDRYAADV
jgi:uncharacterized protein YndB with AHSA1/START domain